MLAIPCQRLFLNYLKHGTDSVVAERTLYKGHSPVLKILLHNSVDVVVVLLFNVHGKHLRSCREDQ